MAARDGRVVEGDRILQVDDTSLRGMENMEAACILRNSGNPVRLMLSRHQENLHTLNRGDLFCLILLYYGMSIQLTYTYVPGCIRIIILGYTWQAYYVHVLYIVLMCICVLYNVH